MYRVTVHIPNPPLLIRREFYVDNGTAVERITDFCTKQNLTYEIERLPTSNYTAVAHIQRELKLAAERRVE